jgi:hypothetical protein
MGDLARTPLKIDPRNAPRCVFVIRGGGASVVGTPLNILVPTAMRKLTLRFTLFVAVTLHEEG